MIFKRLLLLSFLISFLLGCEFDSDESPFTTVDASPKNDLTLEFLVDADTIFISNTTEVYFDVNSDNMNLVEITAIARNLNYPVFFDSGSELFYVRLNQPSFQPNKVYKLQITATSSTGTGSLVDVYGAEKISVTASKLLKVNN